MENTIGSDGQNPTEVSQQLDPTQLTQAKKSNRKKKDAPLILKLGYIDIEKKSKNKFKYKLFFKFKCSS